MLRVCRLGGNFLNKKSFLIFLKKYVIIYIQKKKKIKNMGATKPLNEPTKPVIRDAGWI